MMKRVCLSTLILSLALSSPALAAFAAPRQGAELRQVTLYGPNKRQGDLSRALFCFKTATFGALGSNWDLNYGALYVNEDHDWFQVSVEKGVRSAVRDLGAYDWTDYFDVPHVEPFPKLKEGEERVVGVDVSGADGADGAPGAPAVDGDGVTRPRPAPVDAAAQARPPKKDGVPKVDPIFVKAVVGHMYAVHVVDDAHDFYVLFRVDALVRGDNCTITWKRIPSPASAPAGRE